MRAVLISLATAVVLAVPGCGGDDDEGREPAAPPAPTTTQAEPGTSAEPDRPSEPEPETEPRRERRKRTPASLVECLREEDGVESVLLKGRESEDAVFFEDLVGGRVDVLGVTVSGSSAEVSVFLFASAADAKKAAPNAGGGGVEARAAGSAVVAAPPGAPTEAVDACLAATRYS